MAETQQVFFKFDGSITLTDPHLGAMPPAVIEVKLTPNRVDTYAYVQDREIEASMVLLFGPERGQEVFDSMMEIVRLRLFKRESAQTTMKGMEEKCRECRE